MDYAHQAMRTALSGAAISADMSPEDLRNLVRQLWTQTTTQAGTQTEKDALLQGVYRGILNQASAACLHYSVQAQPQAYFAPAKKEKRQWLKFLLLLPTALVLVWFLQIAIRGGDYGNLALSAVALGTLCASAALFFLAKPAPQPKAYVVQQIDPVKVRSSLERIASEADQVATALYAHVTSQDTGVVEGLDGLSLAEELLDWDCREGRAPEELRTALRIYFRKHAIEAINYTQDRAELFQILPANGTRTIAPALIQKVVAVKEGAPTEQEVLLRQGMACVDATGGK